MPDRAPHPRFSVVIPAYNEAAYLGECLRSVRAQDFPGHVEIIVVDNNSTDDTVAVAREFGITVLSEPEPGVCHARQRGTARARGQIIVSADADTCYDPDWLATVDRWFAAHPDHIAVGGPCYFSDGPRWGRLVQQILFGGIALLHRWGAPVLYITATNFAFRRDRWPGYDTRLAQGGDELDLLRRLRRRGPVGFDPSNCAHTSARRIEKGLVYNFAVSFFFYYILGYALNRLFRRPLLGMAPAFRRSAPGVPATRVARRPPARPVSGTRPGGAQH